MVLHGLVDKAAGPFWQDERPLGEHVWHDGSGRARRQRASRSSTGCAVPADQMSGAGSTGQRELEEWTA
eukprot:6120825-Karenia_brevis.AAC.1